MPPPAAANEDDTDWKVRAAERRPIGNPAVEDLLKLLARRAAHRVRRMHTDADARALDLECSELVERQAGH